MSNNELEILLTLRDQATKQLTKFRSFTKKATEAMKKNWLILAAAIAAIVVVIKKAAETLVNMMKELIKVNSTMEDFRIRIIAVTGSMEIGNQIFKDMTELAAKVPKTFEEIMAAAANLTAVVKDASIEIKQLMPIIVDISSATGLTIEETTGNIIKMYGGGAAAADMFRDRGIKAALGFQESVAYTNKETIEILTKQWKDGTGKYVGAAILLADTWSGIMSMMQDAWFTFKKHIGEDIFEKAKINMKVLLEIIRESKEEGGKYEEVVKNVGDAFSKAFDMGVEGVQKLFVAAGQVIDVFNEIKIVAAGVSIFWLQFINDILWGANILAHFPATMLFINVDENKAAMAEIQADIAQATTEINDLRMAADRDYSTEFQATMDGVMDKFNQIKEQMIIKDAEVAAAAIAAAATEQAKKFSLWEKYNKRRVAVEKKITEDMAKQIKATNTAIEGAFTDTFASIIKGNMSAKEAFTELGNTMIDILVKFMAEQIVQMLFSKAIAAATTKFVAAQAALIAVAWAPAAAAASLATLGENAIPAGIALTATHALSMGLATIGKATAGVLSGNTPAGVGRVGFDSAGNPMSLPALAEGGIVTRPTLALIGESGPEAVVPLGSRGGFRNVHIEVNVTDPHVRDLDDIYTLSEEISNQISKEIERL